MDVNLGGTTASSNSIVVAKNLKFIGSDNTIKTYTTSTSTLDYTQTTWLLNGTSVALTTLTPQVGMVLIIANITSGSTNATVACPSNYIYTPVSTGVAYSQKTTITIFPGGTITLYGASTTAFYVLSGNGVSYV